MEVTEKDHESFNKIMCFLRHYKQLNAILFLVNSNASRQDIYLKYCITLLSNLHHSISPKIMFCFTHSRNSMYGPGEGFKTMQELLDVELNGSGLHLNIGVNCFFVDNEAFLY